MIKGWVKEDLTLVKIHILLARRGVEVPYRTLHRWAVANAGCGRSQVTVRVGGWRAWGGAASRLREDGADP